MKYTVENTVGIGKPLQVFIDGEEIDNVLECDTADGYAIVYRVDKDGNLIADGGDIAKETLRGKITVKPMIPR